MQAALLQWFHQYPQWAVGISMIISIAVALLGVLPSVFVTAANIYFFGFWMGTGISILGEAAGAALSFIAYRYWFKQGMQHKLKNYRNAQLLLTSGGRQAAGLVLVLRLLPFVPSGVVTFAAAIGSIHFSWFLVASTLGKIPALVLEAMLVKGFLSSGWAVQVAISVMAAAVAVWLIYRQIKEHRHQP